MAYSHMTRQSTQPAWRSLASNRRDLILAIITVVILIASIISYAQFLTGIEHRQGFSFIDPVHQLIGPVDFTWPIFLMIYGALIAALVVLSQQPHLLFRVLRAYTILIALRMLAMWMMPLDPPSTMIALTDPIVEFVSTGGASTLTRDLFFSGHTATLVLIGAMVPNRIFRRSYYAIAAVVATMLMAQHVHYTVDIIVAPMAALTAAYLSGAFTARG